MNHLTAKTRITIGLTSLIVTLMVTLMSIGIGPNERRVEVANRASVAELTAIACSIHLNRDQTKELNTLLRGLKERNERVASACIRRNNGRVETSIGDHENQWNAVQRTSETHVEIPLQRGKLKWGSLEILFHPVQAKGIAGLIASRWTQYLVFSGGLAFFVVYFFLGYVLKQLDPSQAVPKRVRNALNTLAEGLILTDKKGRMMLANDAFAKWAGAHPDSLFGTDAKNIKWNFEVEVDGEMRMIGQDQPLPWEQALANETPLAGHLMKMETADGELIALVANSSPILGPNGKYVGALTSFEDITELEVHKVELSRARIAADDANQAKSKFLARMSHEIRTPMNAILGYTEVLQFGMEEDEEKRTRHLSTIQTSGEHLLALINDILDLSKIESGQMEMEMTKVSVHELISNVVAVLSIKAEEKGIDLTYIPKGKIPESVMIDGVRLKQAVINLVGNAIKFTAEGGVMIQPELINQEGRTLLAIHVIDSGIGMSQSALAKVFEPFAQADTSITRRFGGTGLGLTICRELCEQMGGGIEAVSQAGKGSAFTITLDPGDLSNVALLDISELEVACRIRPKEISVDDCLPAANVLIVDDGETNRELVALFLKRAGVKYEMAVDGKMAVEKIQAGNFDVVLMDMHMPVMDGFEATRLLRSQGNSIPIIALTADAMAQDERKCRDAGCSGFLPKPINRDRLFMALRDALPNPIPSTTKPETAKSMSTTVDKPPSHALEPTRMTTENCDAERIQSSLPMDDEDFIEIAKMFVDNLQTKVEQMAEAIERQNFDQLYEIGHWLKGSGGSAGFDDFNAPGLTLEALARTNDADQCRTHVELIRGMLERIWVPDSALEV